MSRWIYGNYKAFWWRSSTGAEDKDKPTCTFSCAGFFFFFSPPTFSSSPQSPPVCRQIPPAALNWLKMQPADWPDVCKCQLVANPRLTLFPEYGWDRNNASPSPIVDLKDNAGLREASVVDPSAIAAYIVHLCRYYRIWSITHQLLLLINITSDVKCNSSSHCYWNNPNIHLI